MQIRLQPLGDHHDRAAFSCGQPSIDEFLHKLARQRQSKGLGTTMVATDANGEPDCIVAFYYVVIHEFRGDELPDPWRASMKVGRLNAVPGALLAQLGVSTAFQGQGIGKSLIREIFKRSISLMEIGCAAIVADPIDEIAANLYAGFDFRPLGDGSKRMIVPMKTVVAAIDRLKASAIQGGSSS